jgi:fibronectin-binding autotransporter adhesin
MKTTIRKLKLLLLLGCSLATTAAFGQLGNYTWTGLANGTNLDTTGNYTTNGTDPALRLPDGNDGSGIQESVFFDGRTTTNLSLTKNGNGWPNSGFNTIGVNFVLTPNQTNDVQMQSAPGVTRSGQIGWYSFTNNSAHSSLTIGGAYTLNNAMLMTGRPAGQTHYWVNNSTAPIVLAPSVELQAGGGNAYTIDFQGTGDFIINNILQTDNGGNISLQMDGTGSVIWTKTGYNVDAGGASQGAPGGIGTVTVNTNKIIIKTAGNLTPNGFPSTIGISNSAALVWDMGTSADTINRTITGDPTASLVLSNGVLTLSSGSSTFPGTFALYGGTLIAGGTESPQGNPTGPLGFGSTISFHGGALASSIANAFDYSGRFDTSAGQAYKIDTGGQSVTFSNALTSVGGTFTKVGAGTLTMAGTNTYSGTTTVNGGRLVLVVSTGAGAIVIADGAQLGLTEIGSTQVTPATLTVGTGGGAILEFNNVTNTASAPLAVTGGISTGGGTITINVNSGSFNTIGQSFPLFTWGSGAAPAVTLGSVNGASGTLSTNGNSIVLTIASTPYVWTGGSSAIWDTVSTGDWLQSGASKVWANGVLTVFDDSATTVNTNITITGHLSPASVTVNSTLNPYSIISSAGNDIEGTGGLTKVGNSTLVLSGGANAFTGPTAIKGGTLSVSTLANSGSPSDIGSASSAAANLVIDGGTLQYTGAAADSDHQLTLGSGSGTIDASGAGALRLTAAGPIVLSGGGGRSLTLTGNLGDSNTLAGNLADSPSGASVLNKSGSGTWIVTGTNTYSGVTTIGSGTLQIGDGGGSGSLGTGSVLNNGALDFHRTNSVTVNGVISGTGSVTNDGTGTVILANNNTYSGATAINAGTLQVGNGGATGQLNLNGNILDDGTIIFNSTGGFTLNGVISGAGNLIKRGSGLLLFQGANTYTGWTTVDAGAQLQFTTGNFGATPATSVITNNGTIIFDRQDNAVYFVRANIVGSGVLVKDVHNPNAGDITLTGTNTYTGNTIIKGGAIVLGDAGGTPFGGTLSGNVIFTNSAANDDAGRFLTFNRAEDYTFAGSIIGQTKGTNITGNTSEGNLGQVTQNGTANLILTGNNTYAGGTIINAGSITVGAGGTGGSLGTGNITDNTLLTFNRDGNLTVPGVISGGGSVIEEGTGVVTLTASNTYSGFTTISNGTLAIVAVGGDVNVYGGALGAGPLTAPTNVFITGNLNLNGGALVVPLNKSLVQSNSFITASAVNYTAGSLRLTNAGPSLAVGDKFVLFSQPVLNGHTIPVGSEYATFRNDLETDGSVTVTSVLQPPPASFTAPFLLNGSNIVISATNNFGPGGTYTLFGTNKLTVPLSSWPVISSGSFNATGQLFLTNPVSSGQFFYILRQP